MAGSGRNAPRSRVVVGVVGSSPREAGAAMAVSEGSEVAGSVSGGCVEGAVVEAALEILGGERDAGVITFGYSDEDAFAVGLTCGGTIHLFVEPVESDLDSPLYAALRSAIETSRPVALVTVIDGIGVGRKLLVGADASTVGTLGRSRSRSGGEPGRARGARSRSHLDPALRRTRRGARRGGLGVHRVVRGPAAHGHLRSRRLHRRSRARRSCSVSG